MDQSAFLNLPYDVATLEMLNKLEIPDLVRFFAANKEIAERYRPFFEEKIQTERTEWLSPESATTAYQKYIEDEIRNISTTEYTSDNKLCLITPEMTNIMNLNSFYTINGQAIYTPRLFKLWWTLYTYAHGLNRANTFYPDKLMADLFGLNEGWMTSITYLWVLSQKYLNCNVDIPSFHSVAVPVIPELASALYNERKELTNMIGIVRLKK